VYVSRFWKVWLESDLDEEVAEGEHDGDDGGVGNADEHEGGKHDGNALHGLEHHLHPIHSRQCKGSQNERSC
jgi:hypothetical protein